MALTGRRAMPRGKLFPLVLCLMAMPVVGVTLDITETLLQWVENTHGAESRQRVAAWRELMAASEPLDELKKLEAVNDFFNRLQFVPDITHWQQEDYWATPLETLATGGGDCEDLSIGKYYTLKAIGIDENKLRLTYVKALRLNQAHMVVTYFSDPDAAPLVLDNLLPAIQPATERDDLAPVYSFNGTGLWLARQRGAGKLAGNAGQLNLWRDLQERMGREPK